MAEGKKTKGKGKGKKILIIASAIVLVVALIVVLVVALPKGKTSQEALNEVSSISMVDNEDTKAGYQNLANKIETTAGVQYYKTEIDTISNLILTIDQVTDFYNEYYPLAKGFGRYSSSIDGAINKIKKIEKQLNNILAEAGKATTNGITHLQNVWIDYRAAFTDQLHQYKKMFDSLNKMYHNCLGQALVVNDASKLVLNTIDDYMNEITELFDELVAKDIKGNKEADYSLGSIKNKVNAFRMFTNKYIIDRTFIQSYYTSTSENYALLNMFFEKFGETNLQAVIKSISDGLMITYSNDAITSEDIDAQQSLNKIKLFVKGGL